MVAATQAGAEQDVNKQLQTILVNLGKAKAHSTEDLHRFAKEAKVKTLTKDNAKKLTKLVGSEEKVVLDDILSILTKSSKYPDSGKLLLADNIVNQLTNVCVKILVKNDGGQSTQQIQAMGSIIHNLCKYEHKWYSQIADLWTKMLGKTIMHEKIAFDSALNFQLVDLCAESLVDKVVTKDSKCFKFFQENINKLGGKIVTAGSFQMQGILLEIVNFIVERLEGEEREKAIIELCEGVAGKEGGKDQYLINIYKKSSESKDLISAARTFLNACNTVAPKPTVFSFHCQAIQVGDDAGAAEKVLRDLWLDIGHDSLFFAALSDDGQQLVMVTIPFSFIAKVIPDKKHLSFKINLKHSMAGSNKIDNIKWESDDVSLLLIVGDEAQYTDLALPLLQRTLASKMATEGNGEKVDKADTAVKDKGEKGEKGEKGTGLNIPAMTPHKPATTPSKTVLQARKVSVATSKKLMQKKQAGVEDSQLDESQLSIGEFSQDVTDVSKHAKLKLTRSTGLQSPQHIAAAAEVGKEVAEQKAQEQVAETPQGEQPVAVTKTTETTEEEVVPVSPFKKSPVKKEKVKEAIELPAAEEEEEEEEPGKTGKKARGGGKKPAAKKKEIPKKKGGAKKGSKKQAADEEPISVFTQQKEEDLMELETMEEREQGGEEGMELDEGFSYPSPAALKETKKKGPTPKKGTVKKTAAKKVVEPIVQPANASRPVSKRAAAVAAKAAIIAAVSPAKPSQETEEEEEKEEEEKEEEEKEEKEKEEEEGEREMLNGMEMDFTLEADLATETTKKGEVVEDVFQLEVKGGDKESKEIIEPVVAEAAPTGKKRKGKKADSMPSFLITQDSVPVIDKFLLSTSEEEESGDENAMAAALNKKPTAAETAATHKQKKVAQTTKPKSSLKKGAKTDDLFLLEPSEPKPKRARVTGDFLIPKQTETPTAVASDSEVEELNSEILQYVTQLKHLGNERVKMRKKKFETMVNENMKTVYNINRDVVQAIVDERAKTKQKLTHVIGKMESAFTKWTTESQELTAKYVAEMEQEKQAFVKSGQKYYNLLKSSIQPAEEAVAADMGGVLANFKKEMMKVIAVCTGQ